MNVTIPFTLVIGVILALSGVIIVLWAELKKKDKKLLEMTIKFIESNNNTRTAIANLTKTIEANTKAVLTVNDIWKGVRAKEFFVKKGEAKKTGTKKVNA